MGVIIPQIASAAEDRASGGQIIDGSLTFKQGLQNGTYGEYLKRTPSSDGNRRTYTISMWVNRTYFCGRSLGNGYNVNHFSVCGANDFYWGYTHQCGNDIMTFYDDGMKGTNGNATHIDTTSKYRDQVGWYHVVAVCDSTNATEDDRVRMYVNGVRIDYDLCTDNLPAQNKQSDWGDASYVHYLGRKGSGWHFAGSLAQVYNIDGQALEPTEFGFTDPLTGTWRPKKYTGNFNFYGISTFAIVRGDSSNGGHGSFQAWSSLSNLATNVTTFTQGSTSSALAIDFGSSGTYRFLADREFVTGGYNMGYSNDGTNWTGITATQEVEITGRYFQVYRDTGSGFGGCGFGQRGTNSCYLPLDGNSLIGQDKSGNGNDWTPVNTGGSNVIPKATGALPILNTVNGGKFATPGFRGQTLSLIHI